jgi:hypothetical protein
VRGGSTRPMAGAKLARMAQVDPAEIARRHLEKLLTSEQLGKSESSRKLVTYLVERAIRNDAPKETEIALDVFGKDPSFNGSDNSVVRVSVRTLRQKLAEYYAGPGRSDELHFEIPKGGYRLSFNTQPPQPVPPQTPVRDVPPAIRWPRTAVWATAAALALLAGSILFNVFQWNGRATVAPQVAGVLKSPVWADIASSRRPLTIVLGDLFMFTQTDPATGRTLTVRDSGINSSEELRAFLASNPSFAAERGQRYVTMIQKSAAIGMASILPLVNRPGRSIDVTVRDDFTVDAIRRNDIIYLGPLARLGPLAGYYQMRSRYRYNAEGSTITDNTAGKVFSPEGALGAEHLDYALAAKFIGPTGNHIMIFTSGARNAGLLQIVRTLTSPEGLKAFEAKLHAKSPSVPDEFEALLTVTGFKATDLTAEVIEVSALPAVGTHTASN